MILNQEICGKAANSLLAMLEKGHRGNKDSTHGQEKSKNHSAFLILNSKFKKMYFDNASTSFPKPESVYRAIDHAMRASGGNPGRGVHKKSVDAAQTVWNVRADLAALFGIADPGRLVFTFNATDALNMAIKGFVHEGDHVITSCLEHNSILRPLSGLEANGGVAGTRLPVGSDGFIDPDDIVRNVTPATRLVAITHASNVLGTVQPIAAIGAICRDHGLTLLVDAAQSAGEIPIDVEAMGIDMLAFPGHKSLLGPQGTGGLYVRDGIDLNCWREGGTGSESENLRQPGQYPTRLEAGTHNLPGIIGLGEAVRFLQERGIETLHRHSIKLVARIIDALTDDDRFTIYGSRDLTRHVHVLSITINGIDPAAVSAILDSEFDISVRTGLLCAAPIHECIGTYPTGTIRISPGCFTTEEETDILIMALKDIANRATE